MNRTSLLCLLALATITGCYFKAQQPIPTTNPTKETTNTTKEKGLTKQEIEKRGDDLIDQYAEFPCTLVSIDYTLFRLLHLDKGAVGLRVKDRNGDEYQYIFASQGKHDDDLRELKPGQFMRLTGHIEKTNHNLYCFFVDDILSK